MRNLCAIGLILLALLPAASLAWTWRAMPHLGFYHDDSIYWVSAKSLAEGAGYRIASLPGQPYQTKYPPLYPALLALIWKAAPQFPGNLPWAMLLAFLCLPAYALLVRELLKQYQFTWSEQCGLAIAAALNPVAVLFSVSLMPELLFTALLLVALILAERATTGKDSVGVAALAGLAAGLAYLTRSAALPLLFTVPLCLVLRRRPRSASAFFAAMLPAVAGWQWWTRAHLSHSQDLVTLYYTNYFGFQLYNVPLHDLPLVVWHNLDGLLMGIGKALTFDFEIGSKHLERIVAIASLAGCVRLARSRGKFQFLFAAAGFCALLLVWHYQPDQRFVFPLYPLLLAGLWTELKNVARVMRIAWRKPAIADRAVAGLVGGALAALALFVTFTTASGLLHFLPKVLNAHREGLEARLPAYEWINRNAQAGASVFAYDDPLLFLYTGRASCGLPIPPRLFYHNDDNGIDRLLASIPEFVRDNRLDYLLLTQDDFYRDLQSNGARHLRTAVERSREFQPLYRTTALSIYRFTPAAAPAASGR